MFAHLNFKSPIVKVSNTMYSTTIKKVDSSTAFISCMKIARKITRLQAIGKKEPENTANPMR